MAAILALFLLLTVVIFYNRLIMAASCMNYFILLHLCFEVALTNIVALDTSMAKSLLIFIFCSLQTKGFIWLVSNLKQTLFMQEIVYHSMLEKCKRQRYGKIYLQHATCFCLQLCSKFYPVIYETTYL
jgi:hypothetical protein